jgi:hypothetical protein
MITQPKRTKKSALGTIRPFNVGEFSAATSSDRLSHLLPYLRRLLDVAFGFGTPALGFLGYRADLTAVFGASVLPDTFDRVAGMMALHGLR